MSTITLTPPDRTLTQRFAALDRANEIRSARASLKRDLKAGRAHIHDLLIDPPDCITTMRVFDLLVAVPKVGRVKANKVLSSCRVSPSRSVGGLTVRQRGELAGLLVWGVTAGERAAVMSALRRKEPS
jgi:hypothetical protein